METKKLKGNSRITDKLSRGWWPVLMLCALLLTISYVFKLVLEWMGLG